ncbi:hypothetical protein, partial [Bifidobacterium sp. UTBIF-78]|uniref:hypothetical protein n=1 Tax=Bifidobacterium sp. UTBIF-78 TaxID=1465263 RepID=UPI001C6160A8
LPILHLHPTSESLRSALEPLKSTCRADTTVFDGRWRKNTALCSALGIRRGEGCGAEYAASEIR